jgi:hypothetical protein
MPLLNCGKSSKLAQYFIFSLAIRMFRLFPRRKHDCVCKKNQSGQIEYQLPLLTVGVMDGVDKK